MVTCSLLPLMRGSVDYPKSAPNTRHPSKRKRVASTDCPDNTELSHRSKASRLLKSWANLAILADQRLRIFNLPKWAATWREAIESKVVLHRIDEGLELLDDG